MEEAAGMAAVAHDERPATRGREEGGAGAAVGAFDALAHATPQVTQLFGTGARVMSAFGAWARNCSGWRGGDAGAELRWRV